MQPRIRAALFHFTLSAVVAGAVFLPIYFLWYPGVLFESAGGRGLFFLTVGVQMTVGPLITLIIFKPGKWGLVFDLWVIGIVQAAALSYGVYVLFEARPVYIAFVKDRFEIVRANAFPEGELAKAHATGYDNLSWTGPRIVGVKLPTDPHERLELMESSFAGIDAENFPRYYVPYADVRGEVTAKAGPLDTLRKRNPQRAGEIGQALAAIGRKEEDVRFLPLRAGKDDLAVLVDAKSGEIVRIMSLFPWAQK